MPTAKKIKQAMNRMRLDPSIFDYCYMSTSANLKAMHFFCDHTEEAERVIDIGCGSKPFEPLFKGKEYIGFDFNPIDNTVLLHDLNNPLPLDDNSAEAIILSEVLEHHPNPFALLAEVNRVVSPSAKIFISTPFALPVHGAPFDFHRYTHFFYEHLCEKYEWELVYFSSSNTIFSTPVQVINQMSIGLPMPIPVLKSFWFLTNLLSLILDTVTKIFNPKKRRKLQYAFPMGYCAVFKPK
jgi:SAM-dependent methyltransferase